MVKIPYHSSAEEYPPEEDKEVPPPPPPARHDERKPTWPFGDLQPASRDNGFYKTAKLALDNGYSPLPIKFGTKRPALLAWSDKCLTPMTDAELRLPKYQDAGLGVACGYNGLIILDVDTDELEIQELIASVIPRTPVQRKGRKGIGLFFR